MCWEVKIDIGSGGLALSFLSFVFLARWISAIFLRIPSASSDTAPALEEI